MYSRVALVMAPLQGRPNMITNFEIGIIKTVKKDLVAAQLLLEIIINLAIIARVMAKSPQYIAEDHKP